ncbi:MAG: 50S ribosomal protein L25 [Pirellulales bacterium]|nr:50S ribosomal protein L25 [Pirellulales bacterium]
MAETLTVQIREQRGSRQSQRLRRQGQVPAVLYGHGAEPVSLCVPAEQVSAAIRHGSRLVDLSGAVSEKALIGDLQWDTYGNDVLHLDFVRVSEGERVTLTVSLETRGEAPGVKEGGVLDLVLHELEIECPVTAIPEKILVNVKELHLEQHLTAGQLTLPPEVTLVTDADVTVVTCHAVSEEGEESAAPGAGEPEIIGRKAESDEEDT